MVLIQSNAAIADTVAEVFRGREYMLHQSVSLWDIITRWIVQAITRLFGLAAEYPAVGYVVRAAIIVAVVLIAARLGYGFFLTHRAPALSLGRRGSGRPDDWWTTAQELATRGDYTAAAHALYLALITAAALRGLVSLHDSKTTGDYLREIRRAAIGSDISHFTDFTRSYETVIYGIGTCDSDRFARLHAIAAGMLASMLGPVAGPAMGAAATPVAGTGA